MPSPQEHHSKAKDNLRLVSEINSNLQDTWWDWQVTIIFYSALHIINSYLSNSFGLHYRTHEQVNNALNPFNETSVAKIDEIPYSSYLSLKNLSRRSRYLVHESKKKDNDTFFTYEKHFAKSVRHYEIIAKWFNEKHGIEIPNIDVNCSDLKVNSPYTVQTSK